MVRASIFLAQGFRTFGCKIADLHFGARICCHEEISSAGVLKPNFNKFAFGKPIKCVADVHSSSIAGAMIT